MTLAEEASIGLRAELGRKSVRVITLEAGAAEQSSLDFDRRARIELKSQCRDLEVAIGSSVRSRRDLLPSAIRLMRPRPQPSPGRSNSTRRRATPGRERPSWPPGRKAWGGHTTIIRARRARRAEPSVQNSPAPSPNKASERAGSSGACGRRSASTKV